MLFSVWTFPTWLEAHRRYQELFASGLRVGPITCEADGTYTFMSEFPR